MTDPNLFTAISRDARVRAALYLSVALSYAAAVREDALAVPMLAVFVAAALWSLLFEHRFLRPFFPAALKIGLIGAGAAVFLLFFVGGVARPADSFANAIARFLFWNATVFVLSRHKTEYDVWTLGIIDVSLFMIAGAFVQPPLFVPLFLGALACMIYAFHRLALLRCGSAGARGTRGFAVLAVQFALVVEVAALVFFLFPRGVFTARPGAAADAPAMTTAAPDASPRGVHRADRTGLPGPSDALGLESIAPIKQDLSLALVMRVQSLRAASRWKPGDPLYIRGGVYDRYLNGSWTSTAELLELEADDAWIAVTPATTAPDELHQEIRAAPTGGVALAIGDPIRIKVPRARYDGAGTFFAGAGDKGMEYEVVSAWHTDDAARRIRALHPVPEAALLAFPAGLSRLQAKALEIVDGHTWTVSRIEALRAWLHSHAGLEYRLTGFEAPARVDPVEHFLFEARHGYCMHFASALALMCRAIGIPARLATGYYANDFDPETSEYVVRQRDAHAWVEVQFPGRGWIRFDPTPADATGAGRPPEGAPVETGDPSKGVGPVAPVVPARSWDQYILEYDPGAQTHALRGILRGIGSALGSVARFAVGPVHLGAMAAALAIAILLYRLLPRERRARLRRMLAGLKERSSVAFYSDFLFLASRHGVHKPAGMTGREFAIVASRTLPGDAVALVTDAFYEVRYAGRSLDGDAASRVHDALGRIEAHAQTDMNR